EDLVLREAELCVRHRTIKIGSLASEQAGEAERRADLVDVAFVVLCEQTILLLGVRQRAKFDPCARLIIGAPGRGGSLGAAPCRIKCTSTACSMGAPRTEQSVGRPGSGDRSSTSSTFLRTFQLRSMPSTRFAPFTVVRLLLLAAPLSSLRGR